MTKIIRPTRTAVSEIDSEWFPSATISSLTFTEPCLWMFKFSSGVSLQVECLWRLLDNSHIVLTSEDHAQNFGLPGPMDSATEARRIVREQRVVGFVIREETLDLLFTFSQGKRLEILPTSSGYEAWNLSARGRRFVAMGGGRLDSYATEISPGGATNRRLNPYEWRSD